MVSPIKYVAGVAPRPLLLVPGNQDEIVDVSHIYKLYDRAVAIIIDWLKPHPQIS